MSGEQSDKRSSIPGFPAKVANRGDYLHRAEVLQLLRIKKQTLYAYVSRGYIRSVPDPERHCSFYVREDVERVRSRSLARLGSGPIAAAAMQRGEPVIGTAITEITDAGPRYRGRLAGDLARARTPFENVAEFLWTGSLSDEPVTWQKEDEPPGLASLLRLAAELHRDAHGVQIMEIAVLALGIAAGTRRERIRTGWTPISLGRALIRAQTGVLGLLGPRRRYMPLRDGESIAAAIARLLGIRLRESVLDALNSALVIVADHELNPATFAARVATSAAGDMHSCISAALSTHYGTLIGRACDRVEELFEAPAAHKDVLARVARMHQSERSLPGFDHPLYPHGDPRARWLIESAVAVGGTTLVVRNMLTLASQLKVDYGVLPSIEFGLVLLCRALGLKDRSASCLYALGRTSGWLAHILEQRLAGFVIRPRAKYSSNEEDTAWDAPAPIGAAVIP